MIIARNWLEEWIDLSGISSDKICEKLNAIGLEVDSFTSVRMPENIVIGRVVSCKDHENSDHLHVCEVDVGPSRANWRKEAKWDGDKTRKVARS